MNVGECVRESIILQFANARNAATVGSPISGFDAGRARDAPSDAGSPRISGFRTMLGVRAALRRIDPRDRGPFRLAANLEIPARLRIAPNRGACERRGALAIPQRRRMR